MTHRVFDIRMRLHCALFCHCQCKKVWSYARLQKAKGLFTKLKKYPVVWILTTQQAKWYTFHIWKLMISFRGRRSWSGGYREQNSKICSSYFLCTRKHLPVCRDFKQLINTNSHSFLLVGNDMHAYISCWLLPPSSSSWRSFSCRRTRARSSLTKCSIFSRVRLFLKHKTALYYRKLDSYFSGENTVK